MEKGEYQYAMKAWSLSLESNVTNIFIVEYDWKSSM